MKHADADEQVIGFADRDDALGHRIGDRLGDAGLRRAEHLKRLLGALIVTLVEQIVFGLVSRSERRPREELVKPSLLLTRSIGESQLGGRTARSDYQIDMSDFIAFADHRLADQKPC